MERVVHLYAKFNSEAYGFDLRQCNLYSIVY